jgi:hypothetical protein
VLQVDVESGILGLEQCLVVLFHTASVASFGCGESQSYVVGDPGSIGIAKLRFQNHPNLLQIIAASFIVGGVEKWGIAKRFPSPHFGRLFHASLQADTKAGAL